MVLDRLKVMRKIDVRMLFDLGIVDPHADEFTAYVVWGKLCTDPIVAERAAVVWARPENQYPSCPNQTGIFCYDAVQIVEQEMSESEKVALRDRVIAACTPRKS
jgi:hypothetical protein